MSHPKTDGITSTIASSVSRREFLLGASAFLVAQNSPATAFQHEPGVLRAAEGIAKIGPDSLPATQVWAYGNSVPGPIIRAAQGARVSGKFENALPQASTVHWHGVRIANSMDGVPDLTQAPVPPGKSFDYSFSVPDAGTYWYHPHNRTWEQMARGLYGALIVEEPVPPEVDFDEVLLLDDWRLDRKGQIDESFGRMMDWAHAGRLGNWTTVNGTSRFSRPIAQHERARLRLVNTSNARIFLITFQGLDGWVVALDGQPLSAIQRLDQIVLAPAQRADVIVDAVGAPGTKALLHVTTRSGNVPLAEFDTEDPIRVKRLPPPSPLPANPITPLSVSSDTQSITLTMEGGAMGGMRGAIRNGRRLPMPELMNTGLMWAFNGVAGMPEAPLAEISRGETVKIEVVNRTGWPHAMHLHGHHFQALDGTGGLGPLRDTLLIDANKRTEIAFVADNPGDWLFHCHMLEHTAGGMATWLHVT